MRKYRERTFANHAEPGPKYVSFGAASADVNGNAGPSSRGRRAWSCQRRRKSDWKEMRCLISLFKQHGAER